MLGIRDIFLIAPNPSPPPPPPSSSPSMHHHQTSQPISSDNPSLPSSSSTSLGVGLGIFPLLTATPCIPSPPNPVDTSRFWTLTTYPHLNKPQQQQQQQQQQQGNMLSFGTHHQQQQHGHVAEGSASEDGNGDQSGLKACQDCGNKAKKGCEFVRCRTCCRGRGYDCSTHVRSTWVPASRRKERQSGVTVAVTGDGVATSGSSGSSSVAKRPRFMMSSKNANSSLRQSLPDQVRAPAVFKCHRVTAISNGEAEIAYQATVKISGHVFKGLLYDRGVDVKNEYPCISHLHLGSGSNQRNGDSSSPPVPPSNVGMASTS